jgi:hypothetical protein
VLPLKISPTQQSGPTHTICPQLHRRGPVGNAGASPRGCGPQSWPCGVTALWYPALWLMAWLFCSVNLPFRSQLPVSPTKPLSSRLFRVADWVGKQKLILGGIGAEDGQVRPVAASGPLCILFPLPVLLIRCPHGLLSPLI